MATVDDALDGGADINLPDGAGNTALYAAAVYSLTEDDGVRMIDHLIARGATVDSPNVREGLARAVSADDLEIVRALLRNGVDPNVLDERKHPILHDAISFSRGPTMPVALLLAAGANPNQQDFLGWRALQPAILKDSPPLVIAQFLSLTAPQLTTKRHATHPRPAMSRFSAA